MPTQGIRNAMTKSIKAQVAIVGAGPVGLTLALDLAARGISSVVIEQRPLRSKPSVKCNHISSRTMEIFRRLGLAQEIRSLPACPTIILNDVVVRTRCDRLRLTTRIPIPSRQSTRSVRRMAWFPAGPRRSRPIASTRSSSRRSCMRAGGAVRRGITILNRTPLRRARAERRSRCSSPHAI